MHSGPYELRRIDPVNYKALSQRKWDLRAQAAEIITESPTTYKEAMSRPNADQWKEAMDNEMKSMRENNVDIVSRPSNQNVVGSRWVFCEKTTPEGQPKLKARLVAQGFTQKNEVDYFTTFAPVVPIDFIRFMFSHQSSV